MGPDSKCVECGQYHGPRCLLCAQRAFHRESCPMFVASLWLADRDLKHLLPVMADGPGAAELMIGITAMGDLAAAEDAARQLRQAHARRVKA